LVSSVVVSAALFGVIVGVWSSVDSLYAAHGVIRTTGLLAAILFVLVLLGCWAARPSVQRRIASIVALVLLVASVAVALVAPGEHSHKQPTALASAPQSASSSPSSASSNAPSTTPSSASSAATAVKGISVPNPDECGPEAQVSVPLPSVQVCVYYWCRGDVFNLDGTESGSQAQIKIRPRLINNGASNLSIAITNPSAVRLLVTDAAMPASWQPPPLTARAGDRPVVVSYEGTNYWALPPNVPHDAALLSNGTGYTGFATSWSGTELAAGGSYYVPLTHNSDGSPVQSGDLVFQVPQSAQIIGLAVVTPSALPSVLGVALANTWPSSSDPSSF
jgi:hypothetical protein